LKRKRRRWKGVWVAYIVDLLPPGSYFADNTEGGYTSPLYKNGGKDFCLYYGVVDCQCINATGMEDLIAKADKFFDEFKEVME